MVQNSKSSTKILIIADTHALNFDELPKTILQAIINADWVIHAGDYTSKNVLKGLIKLKGKYFKGVYGNADPLSIRKDLHTKEIVEIFGKNIGITHPASGGSSEFTERKVIAEFKNNELDVLIYGHTHERKIVKSKGMMIINPGKAYVEKNSFGPPPSFVVLTIGKEIIADIQLIEI